MVRLPLISLARYPGGNGLTQAWGVGGDDGRRVAVNVIREKQAQRPQLHAVIGEGRQSAPAPCVLIQQQR